MGNVRMKSTIMGFRQEQLIKYKISLEEVLILDSLVSMYASPSMKKDNKNRVWCKQDFLLRKIPIIGSLRTLQRRLNNLQNKGFIKCELQHELEGVKGNYSMYTILPKIDELTDFGGNEVEDNNLIDKAKKTQKVNKGKVKFKADYKFINKLIGEFKEKYKAELDFKHTKEMYEAKGEKVIVKYFENFQKIIDSYTRRGKTIESLGGLFKDCVIKNYVIPKGKEGKYLSKPIQATNYEQREYDDEFFDNLAVDLSKYGDT